MAVKQLDRNGLQGNKEFLAEVLTLSLLHHPNLVNLIGYCADGDQRLLVFEYLKGGSLDDHLLGIFLLLLCYHSSVHSFVLNALYMVFEAFMNEVSLFGFSNL